MLINPQGLRIDHGTILRSDHGYYSIIMVTHRKGLQWHACVVNFHTAELTRENDSMPLSEIDIYLEQHSATWTVLQAPFGGEYAIKVEPIKGAEPTDSISHSNFIPGGVGVDSVGS